MRAFIFISMALCVTAAAAAEVQGTSTWFPDPLASSKASTMSGYRSKVEKETLCFRTSSYCFTKPDFNQPEAISTNWMEVNMECTPCPEAHHHGSYGPHHPDSDSDSIAAQLTPILSKCLMQSQVSYPSIDLPNHKGMGIYGTYKATCVLQEDPKAGCKFPPTCEDTLVTIQGVIYSVDHAVVAGPISSAQPLYAPDCTPEMPCDPVKQRCPAPSRGGSTKASAMAAAMAKVQKAGRAQIPVQDGKENTGPKPVNQTKPDPKDPKPPVIITKPGTQTVKVGGASLYKGTFTVQSTTHPLKYTRGHHQYSIFIGPTPEDTDLKLAEGLPRLGDAVTMFDFVADSEPSYY